MSKRLEDLLKEKFSGLELEDTEEGWNNVASRIHSGKSLKKTWYFAAASVSVALFALIMIFFRSPVERIAAVKKDSVKNASKVAMKNNEETVVVKKENSQGRSKSPARAAKPYVALVEFQTQEASKQYYLPDSSLVHLNKHSKIVLVDFGMERREVMLQGEGYFEVMHDKQKPFIVHAGNLNVKVLGTKFNVRAYNPDSIETFLTQGEVACYDEKKPTSLVYLTPGERSLFYHHHLSKNKIADPNYLYWKTHKLVFENASLPEVLLTLEKIFGIRTIVSDASLNNCHLTFKLDDPSVPAVLGVLKSLLKVNYTKEDNLYSISGKGCK